MSETREGFNGKGMEIGGKFFSIRDDDFPDKMSPGRELDILVAQAMGWVLLTDVERLEGNTCGLLPGQAPPPLDDTPRGWPPDSLPRRRGEPGGKIPRYSDTFSYCMLAWHWLEENNPWKGSALALMRDKRNLKAVYRIYDDGERAIVAASSAGYSHAIALAVVEAGKVLGVIDIDIKP